MVLVGGTGKPHLAVALPRARIRNGARGRIYNVVIPVNQLQDEQHAEFLLLFQLVSKYYEHVPVVVATNLSFGNESASSTT